MIEPKFMEYCYWDDKGCHLKENVPEWAKNDYEEWFKEPEPDEDGNITLYND